MANTKDINLNLMESSFFFIGDSGSGKTPTAATFPDPYFFDFDKGMASVRIPVEYDTFKDAAFNKGQAFPDRGIYKYGEAWGKFLTRLQTVGDEIDKGTFPHKTLVFDSATLMAQILMNAILKEDGHSGKNPEIQHYGTESTKLKEIFDVITAWPLIKIVTVHVQRNTNELQGTMEKLPLLTGKFAARSAIYFDEVYFIEMSTKKVGDKTVPCRIVRTQADGIMKQARSRFQVPDKTEANWDAISKAALAKK